MTEIDIILPRKNFIIRFNEKFEEGITGIFGPSGSGKTSLLQTISGLTKPENGKITLAGRVVFDSNNNINLPVEKRNIGYVFQEGRLFPHLTVESNLRYALKLKEKNLISFDEVVTLLNLTHLLKNRPGSISGGERQRVALGRTLLSSPEILLLDEPFSAVDTNLRNQILPFIINIQKRTGIPILVVSHDLPDLLKLTNRLCIINNGVCEGHGEYFRLMKNSSSAQIIGSGNLINSVDMNVYSIEPENLIMKLALPHTDKKTIQTGQTVRVFIEAEDVSISLGKVEHITIQNQLEGIVTDIIDRGSTYLVVTDVGFNLVSEITSYSLKRMGISMGSKVWCLFKSVATHLVSE